MKIKLGLLWLIIFGTRLLLFSQTDHSGISANSRDTIIIRNQKDTVKQTDLIDFFVKTFKIKTNEAYRDQRKIRFSLFPTQSGTSGTKTVVTTFNISFRAGEPQNTNISTIYFIPYLSFSNQYGFQMQSNIWLRKNSWNFTGEYFILNFPQYTWGLGGNSPDSIKTLVDGKQVRFYQNALIKLIPNLAVGIGYALDVHYSMNPEIKQSIQIPDFKTQTISSGITLPVIYDSRRNSNNPEQGTLASLNYSVYDKTLGSTFDWQSLFCDLRTYLPVGADRRNILAFRSFYWTILSGHGPYLDQPSTRWEPAAGSASRGIQQGRYRSNAILYGESEFRFGISANGLWGGVLFANVTAPSEYGTQNFEYWHPAGGAGIRLKFNKYSRTNITLDYGMSKDYWSFYINIGEAF